MIRQPLGKALAGFTLIELLVTVAVLAVLATVAIPVAETTFQRGREKELRLALRELRSAIDAYKQASDEGLIRREIDQSGYPPSLQSLVDGTANEKSPTRSMLYFLRRIPRDPFADPTLPPEKTWGLRSYASSAETPTPGIDVYDVYSLSERTGLNGVPFRQW